MHSTTQCHALVLGTTGTTYIRQQQKYIGREKYEKNENKNKNKKQKQNKKTNKNKDENKTKNETTKTKGKSKKQPNRRVYTHIGGTMLGIWAVMGYSMFLSGTRSRWKARAPLHPAVVRMSQPRKTTLPLGHPGTTPHTATYYHFRRAICTR